MGLQTAAVVFKGPRNVELQEIELPPPGDSDVVVENVYTGISVGTEGWILRGERPVDTKFPCVPGYQQTGIVTHVGRNVNDLKPGDRVNAFQTQLPEGINYGWGGHVATSVARRESVVKLPDNVSMKAASLAKLFAVGFHGVQQTRVNPGDLAAVFGLGLIGQGYAQIARRRGATVAACDMARSRLDLARAYSCDAAVLPAELENAVRDIKPEGADIVVETTGRSELIDECVRIAAPQAKIVWQGWYTGRVSFDFHAAHVKRVRMIFPCGWENEEAVLEMLSRSELTIEPLITHVFDARHAKQAYDLMLGDPQDFLGIVLKWRDE